MDCSVKASNAESLFPTFDGWETVKTAVEILQLWQQNSESLAYFQREMQIKLRD